MKATKSSYLRNIRPDEAANIERYKGMIPGIIMRRLRWIPVDPATSYEDLYAVGCWAIVRATRFFKPDKGMKMSTLAYKFILQSVHRAITYQKPQQLGELQLERVTYTDQVEEEGEAYILNKIKEKLGERDAAIVIARAMGQSLADVGRIYGISSERVRQVFEKSVRQLRKDLGASAATLAQRVSVKRANRKLPGKDGEHPKSYGVQRESDEALRTEAKSVR